RRYRFLAWQTVELFLNLTHHYLCCVQELNIEGLAKVTSKIADNTAATWQGREVEFEVTIFGQSADDFSHLGIIWTNIVPLGASQRDTMAIETDDKAHSYHFKFSTGVMGYFDIDLGNCNPEQLLRIRMLFNGKPVREWQEEQLQQVVQNGMRSELLILNEDE
ncbi:MAG: hypothetical protein QF886_21840, partial [Planctomycetota bacterium]|nr:hypothetical protein [Planctomycetota bacterium]